MCGRSCCLSPPDTRKYHWGAAVGREPSLGVRKGTMTGRTWAAKFRVV